MAFCHGLYIEQTKDIPLVRQAGDLQGPWPGWGGFRLLRPAQKPKAVTLGSFRSCLSWSLGFCLSPWDLNMPLPPSCLLAALCPNTSCLVSTLHAYLCLEGLHSFTANRGLASDPPRGLATQVASKASASTEARPCPVSFGRSGAPLACAPRPPVLHSVGPQSSLGLRLGADCQDEGQRKRKVPSLSAFVGIVNIFYS